MMKWWINEIKLRNFILNLNEKFYLPIFENRIRQKYFQNISKTSTLSCSVVQSFSALWRPKTNLRSAMGQDCLSNLELLRFERAYTAQKMRFSIKDFYIKCDQIRSFLGIWSHLPKKSLMKTSFFVPCYVNRVDIEKVIDGYPSKKYRSKFFFQSIFRPKNVDDLLWIS